MSAKILDGKIMSAELKAQIAERTQKMKEKGIVPGLAVILVGNDPNNFLLLLWRQCTLLTGLPSALLWLER